MGKHKNPQSKRRAASQKANGLKTPRVGKTQAKKRRKKKKLGRPKGGRVWAGETEVYIAETMLAFQFPRYQIREKIEEMHPDWGPIAQGTLDSILKKARTSLQSKSGQPRERTIADAQAVYASIMRNPTTPPMAKLKAQERMDAIMAHDPKWSHGDPDSDPISLEVTSPDGTKVKVDFDAKETIRKLVEKRRKRKKESES